MGQYTQDRMDGDFAVMLLGLKRDLRVEQEGVIYPQEVSQQTDYQLSFSHRLVAAVLRTELCQKRDTHDWY